MSTSNRSVAPIRFLLAGLAASSVIVMALPSLAHAATYAFVNKSGNVSTVTANDATTAIATALNIDVHSGVMLLISQIDFSIVGGSVGL